MSAPRPGPTRPAERLPGLDALRGLALLGVLVHGFPGCSVPPAMWGSPALWTDLPWTNLTGWVLGQTLAGYPVRVLFALLFGAGLALFAERITAGGGQPGRWHGRRMAGLLVFGLAHAALGSLVGWTSTPFWAGSLFVTCAVAGLLAFPARRLPPGVLALAGAAVLPAAALAALVAGAPADVAGSQLPPVFAGPLGPHLHGAWEAWLSAAWMLCGMALHRWGFLRGTGSDRFYRRLAAAGLLAGAPLLGFGFWWSPISGGSDAGSLTAALSVACNLWGSLLLALGAVGLLLLATRRRTLPRLLAWLAAVGRMTLTIYLLQSLLPALSLSGLLLFDAWTSPHEIAAFTLIWALLLSLSSLWLRRHPHGPLERLWRTLTYGHQLR